jgi:hypothetical protein
MKIGNFAFILAIFSSAMPLSANNLFEIPNQTRPLFVMDSLISAIRSCYYNSQSYGTAVDRERCFSINQFCNGLNGDGDTVKMICGLYYQEDKERLQLFYDWATSISLGAELIDGDTAIVHFTYEIPEEEGRRNNEYMHMTRFDGKWYLTSF